MVEPSSVLAYLRAPAWVKLEQHTLRGRPVAMLFEHPHRDVEVHVPLWLEARDYAPQLAQALNAIAAAEGRSPWSLLLELRAAHADAVRIHVHDDRLSLPRSLVLLGAIHELLTVCAPPPASRVTELLQQVALGPSEQSGTVCVLIPVAELARAEPGTAWQAADAGPGRFARQVLDRLLAELAAAQRAAAEAVRTASPVVLDAASGPSVGLCRVLGSIAAPVVIEVTWALTRPRPPAPAVRFSAEELAALAAAVTRA